jgi:hypothetical protein
METVKLKIIDFDEVSQSLIVSFASDTTEYSDPVNYQSYAFQPAQLWPDVTDAEEIKFLLAQAGYNLIKQQEKKEMYSKNLLLIESIKNLIGQEAQYTASEIIPYVNNGENIYIDGSITTEQAHAV